jgi:hypothetical protein
LDKPQALQVEFLDDHGRPVAKKPASAIAFRNASAEAHLIIFHQPRSCDDGIDQSADAYNQPRKHGRVLANWPSQWTAGQQRTLRWTLLACPTDRIVETVRNVLNRQ